MSAAETKSGTGGAADTTLLAAIVRGHAIDPLVLSEVDPDAFCAHAVHHGVLPLVCARLATLATAPPALLAAFRGAAAADVAADLVREQELRRLLGALAGAGVDPLVIKGAQLAYTHYPRPDLRPRVDTDLLIETEQRPRAHEVLAALGYQPARQMSGDLVAYQAFYVKRRGALPTHAVDLHWRIANSHVFANVLAYDELAADATPIPRLSPVARGLSSVHALMLACMHRVAHHFDAECLIWLYDIDLLARGMTFEEWNRFVELAAERKVVAVCRRSLEQTAAWLGATVPEWVWQAPRFQGAPDELSAGYLRSRRHLSVIADDVRVLATWQDRWHLLREHFFPPGQYMRTVYAPGSRLPVPVLYAHRLWRGTRKWMMRH